MRKENKPPMTVPRIKKGNGGGLATSGVVRENRRCVQQNDIECQRNKGYCK
jgi:hypothetical protein